MNRKRTSQQHGMQGVFVFVLLGIFAVMSTMMVLLGAQMYRSTVERSAETNQDRVLSAYVRSMVRAGDARGAVSVETYDAMPAGGDEPEDDDDGLVDFGSDGLVDFGDGAPSESAEAAADAGAPALRWVLREEGGAAPESAEESVCAIALTEEIDGNPYVTWIYQYDGQLRELFTDRGRPFRPQDGTEVCGARSLHPTVKDGLLIAFINDEAGNLCTVKVALRCA